MSWLYLPELVEDCSAVDCSAGGQSAPSKSTNIASESSCSGNEMDCFHDFLSGRMLEVSTDGRGVALWMSFLGASRVKDSAAPHLDATALKTFGRRCGGLLQMSLPGACLPRTSKSEQLTGRRKTLRRWLTKSRQSKFPRLTWVRTTFGDGIGYLHTPTTKANYGADSMQKWPSCRAFALVFGTPTHENQEWLMGWPQGWTGLEPLAMGKFQAWLSAHGTS